MSTGNPTIETAYSAEKRNVRGLLYAFFLSFIPHSRNSATRKDVTRILFLTWGAITVLRYLGHTPTGEHASLIYWVTTVIVFSVMSHLWGFEYGVLSAVTADGPGDVAESMDDE